MGNVKVRKERYRRQGLAANPYPTAEQILTSVAAGVATNLTERAIRKATRFFSTAAANRRAGKRVKAEAEAASVVVTPPPKKVAKKTAKKKSKKAA